jgi:membrane-bound metal-dependent hydrolase YbcI (DUF457 family)
VDPLTHALFGKTLHHLDRANRLGRGAAAAFMLGSLAPDVDAVIALRGMDVYLRAHEQGTHALLATPIEGAAVALVLRAVLRGAVFPHRPVSVLRTLQAQPSRALHRQVTALFKGIPPTLWLAGTLGAIGHIFWDFADGGDIRLFAPFAGEVVGWHLVAMADPLIFLVVAAGVAAGMVWTTHRPRLAGVTLVCLAAMLAGKLLSQELAVRAFTRAPERRADRRADLRIEARWGSAVEWDVFVRSANRLRAWRVNAWSGRVTMQFERVSRDEPPQRVGTHALGTPEEPLIAASRQLPVVKNFLALSGLPFVRLERDGDRELVLWSDVRFCDSARCDLSFGAAFDRQRSPLYQVVQIGGLRLIRGVP